MKKTKKTGRGGARKGASRPRIFENPTTFNFKCELEDKLKAKEKYGKSFNQMFVAWLKSVIK